MKNTYELWYKYKPSLKQLFELHWLSKECRDLNETYKTLAVSCNQDSYDWEIRKATNNV